jgi:hypothetical protein
LVCDAAADAVANLHNTLTLTLARAQTALEQTWARHRTTRPGSSVLPDEQKHQREHHDAVKTLTSGKLKYQGWGRYLNPGNFSVGQIWTASDVRPAQQRRSAKRESELNDLLDSRDRHIRSLVTQLALKQVEVHLAAAEEQLLDFLSLD